MLEKIKKKLKRIKLELSKRKFTIGFKVKHLPVPGREEIISESISIDLGKLNQRVYQFCKENDIQYIDMYGEIDVYIEIRGTTEERDRLYDFEEWIIMKPR